ncbi:hypothetical protein ABZ990_02990 [Streptomyces sp. NPDC046203]|uniref:hypothetical protein n=1 Tax=Streptomyces sp. NPDC046203 TaxID=3154602 RepID=UPI0033D6CFF1
MSEHVGGLIIRGIAIVGGVLLAGNVRGAADWFLVITDVHGIWSVRAARLIGGFIAVGMTGTLIADWL